MVFPQNVVVHRAHSALGVKPDAVGANTFMVGVATRRMLAAGVVAAGVGHIGPVSFLLTPGLWEKNSPMSNNLKMTICRKYLKIYQGY